jgi:hypothetical protein
MEHSRNPINQINGISRSNHLNVLNVLNDLNHPKSLNLFPGSPVSMMSRPALLIADRNEGH